MRLIRNVLKHIEKEDRSEAIVQRRFALKNVVQQTLLSGSRFASTRPSLSGRACDFP